MAYPRRRSLSEAFLILVLTPFDAIHRRDELFEATVEALFTGFQAVFLDCQHQQDLVVVGEDVNLDFFLMHLAGLVLMLYYKQMRDF